MEKELDQGDIDIKLSEDVSSQNNHTEGSELSSGSDNSEEKLENLDEGLSENTDTQKDRKRPVKKKSPRQGQAKSSGIDTLIEDVYSIVEKKLQDSESANFRKIVLGRTDLFITGIDKRLVFELGAEEHKIEVLDEVFNERLYLKTKPDDLKLAFVLSSPILKAIMKGNLNSQIALLTNKVKVLSEDASADKIVYFFNLLS